MLLVAACCGQVLAQSAGVPDVAINAGHSNSVTSVVFSPDGRWLASGGHDGAIKLWEIASGRLLRTLVGHTKGVKSIAISPDGSVLASVSEDSSAKLWSPLDGRLLRTMLGFQANTPIMCSRGWPIRTTVNPSSRRVSTASGDGMFLPAH